MREEQLNLEEWKEIMSVSEFKSDRKSESARTVKAAQQVLRTGESRVKRKNRIEKVKEKFSPYQGRKQKEQDKELAQQETERKIYEANQYYQVHPIEFCKDFYGVDLDPWQCEACEAILKYHFLAVCSGSGVGKTALVSMLIPWFLRTHPMCKIPVTAPTQHQLFDLIWAECFRWIQRSEDLKKTLVWTQTKIGVKGYEAVWYAVARTASVSSDGTVAEGLQGFHSDDFLLAILDEASGISDAVIPAIEGAFTGKNAYCIMTGNPTRLSGHFYNVFHNDKVGKYYYKMKVSCLDSPRVADRYVDMMKESYGEQSSIYRIKVLGEFAELNDEQLFPLQYIEQMQKNKKDTVVSPTMPIEIGIDLGRSTAISVATVRQGVNVLAIIEQPREKGAVNETQETVEWINDIINDYDPEIVRIDAIGIGATICDLLKARWGKRVFPFIGGASIKKKVKINPITNKRVAVDENEKIFLNLRAESYWHLREILPRLWAESWPSKLIAEMKDIKKQESVNGKIKIESKKDMQARSRKSPDHLDSLMYAFACNSDRLVETPPPHFNSNVISVNESLQAGSIWNLGVGSGRSSKRGWMHR